MHRRLARFVRVALPVLVLALIATGSIALAHGGQRERDDHHGNQHHKRHGDRDRHGDHRKGEDRDDDGDHGKSACDQGRYSAWDEEWLMMSIEGDRFEIAGGKLAQERGNSSKVEDLGKRLVKDHSKSLDEAIDVAKDLGIEVPGEPSPTQQWQLRVLQTFSGSQFDRWYADLEVQDHKQDIKEAQDEVDKGCNDEVRHLAADDIPVLRQHLELAQEALASAAAKKARH